MLIVILRYLGNLIIGYELFHKDNPESGQMKILEIGKWLEELDNSTDAFYLSINVGLKHVMTATFIHMLFATNLIGECKWVSYLFVFNCFYKYIKKNISSIFKINVLFCFYH